VIAAPIALGLLVRTLLLPVGASVISASSAQQSPITSNAPSQQPARLDESRFDSVTAGALRAILDTATAHSIPTNQLVSLAYQGSAVRASSSKIVNAVRAQYLAMLDARAALGERSTESELSSGAAALRQGADGKSLQAIRVVRPVMGSSVNALVVFSDLMKRGIPGNKARDAVAALARASRTDETLNALQQLVAKNAERGPGMAQDALDRYLRINAPGYAAPAGSKPVTRPPGPPDPQ
jgi:hypothetical protein